MKTRASKLSNPDCGKITASTYHSFCAEVLREYGAFIKLKKDFTIITPQEELEVFKLCKSELKYGSYRGFPKAKDVMEVVSLCLNKLWDVDYAIEDIFANIGDTNIEAMKKTIERMGTYKEENHMLSYDDLLVKMYELLQNEDVRNILERRYKYVMVDEYQDTNKIQEKIVFLLTRDRKNLVVVGDDYQSIYKFRGSEIENIIEFPNRVGGCEQVVIDTNYRSNKEILDVANEVMRDNADFGYPKFMKNTGKSGDKVKFVRPGRCEDEANLILASIKAWRDAGKNMSEYAVLERKSKSSSASAISTISPL
jgi:DNA helicase-2/ATP-dependent DNA helicase PcrA